MSTRKSRRNPLFADAFLESRLAPAVITYPLAPSIVEFDPAGDLDEHPVYPGDVDDFEIIVDPEIDLIQSDDPAVDASVIA